MILRRFPTNSLDLVVRPAHTVGVFCRGVGDSLACGNVHLDPERSVLPLGWSAQATPLSLEHGLGCKAEDAAHRVHLALLLLIPPTRLLEDRVEDCLFRKPNILEHQQAQQRMQLLIEKEYFFRVG
jgi:hypothetical protein